MAKKAVEGESESGTDCNTPEYWSKEFASSKKWFQRYHALARKIEKSYLLMTSEDGGNGGDDTTRVQARYNLFWSNVQTILASMYGRMPKVEVDRTNLDPNDDVARVAGLILERIFNFEAQNLEDSPYYTYKENILDRLVAGMGVCWARYDFTEDKKLIPQTAAPGMPVPEPVEIPIITDELAPIDYVNWEDFRYSPCKRWQDKRWAARRVPMNKDDATKRFTKKVADDIPYAYKGSTAKGADDPDRANSEPMADIWEIWNLSTRAVYWYVDGYDSLLDSKEDPLKLRGFWPCTRPLVATVLPKTFLPRPDFIYAQSQYAELNLIVSRSQLLTEALKVVGVYDKASDAVKNMIQQGNMNQMIPVDNWAMFAEKGGIKGAVDWFPLEMVVNTLEKLILRKATLVQEVYEILGISDIQRGQASSRETATTQKLKAQFGSARSDNTLNEIARFITDNTRLRSEIICRHWQPQTIMERSQIDKTPDKQYAEAAIQLLKNDPSLIARVTVAADTISAPDWDLEKQQRIDFLQAISQFIGMAMPMIEKDPTVGPYMIQIMQWAATGFKGAKQIEGVLDQAYQAMIKNASKPKQPKPYTPQELKDLTSSMKSQAEARQINLETLMAAGVPLDQLPPGVSIIIPAAQAPGSGAPSQAPVGASAPPAAATPSTPRPQVQ